MIVANELHMSLAQLKQEMTPEELWLWHAFFELRADEQAKEVKKAKSRRR
jgi:hypothetical protein